jgi:hypothetical protein
VGVVILVAKLGMKFRRGFFFTLTPPFHLLPSNLEEGLGGLWS